MYIWMPCCAVAACKSFRIRGNWRLRRRLQPSFRLPVRFSASIARGTKVSKRRRKSWRTGLPRPPLLLLAHVMNEVDRSRFQTGKRHVGGFPRRGPGAAGSGRGFPAVPGDPGRRLLGKASPTPGPPCQSTLRPHRLKSCPEAPFWYNPSHGPAWCAHQRPPGSKTGGSSEGNAR